MLYRGLIAALALVTGCASASAPLEGQPDAAGGSDSSGGVDSGVDSSVTIDAPGPCTTMTRQLLMNPTFDATGGWVEDPIGTLPIVTSDDGNSGVTEQSPTMKAWMAGYAQAGATDSLHQDVMIPANTSMLKLTGFYWTKSSELPGSTVYDSANVRIENGTQIIEVLSLNNVTRHTAWQPLDFTVPVAGLSGQTIRLKITSASDTSDTSSFWFDTFALTATHCQ